MAPPRATVEHSDVMMLLPDRVGRLKARLDNVEDVHVPDLYATQSKHDQMIASLDDRFAGHEARLIALHAQMSRICSAKGLVSSHRGPGAVAHRNLFQMNQALGETESKQTSVHLPASRGDDGASFVLEALDGEDHGDVLQEEDLDVALQDEPPGEGAAREADTIDAAESVAKLTGPLAYGVLDTLSQLDIEVRKLNVNATISSAHISKIDSDLQSCIPAVNYATKHVDDMRLKFKNMEDSLTLLHTKIRTAERQIELATAFEVMDVDTKPPATTMPQPAPAMLGDSPPQQYGRT